MKKLKSLLVDNRGLTLIELMVAITMAIIVLMPIYELLITGNKVQIKAFDQADLQEKTQLILNQLVEGKGSGELRVGGLREAKSTQVGVNQAKGIAFVAGNKRITYYLKDNKIYYKEDSPSEGIPAVADEGGATVLENVTSFVIEKSEVSPGQNLYKISINAGKAVPNAGKNEVTMSTMVRPRN